MKNSLAIRSHCHQRDASRPKKEKKNVFCFCSFSIKHVKVKTKNLFCTWSAFTNQLLLSLVILRVFKNIFSIEFINLRNSSCSKMKTTSLQCEQMACLFFSFLAINNNVDLTKVSKVGWSFATIKLTLKIARDFVKSGHTGQNIICRKLGSYRSKRRVG